MFEKQKVAGLLRRDSAERLILCVSLSDLRVSAVNSRLKLGSYFLTLLVVITSLKKRNSVIGYQVYNAMLSRQPARPCAGKLVSQRLRLPDAGEWIPHNRFYQVERSDGDVAIGYDPVA